MAVQRAERAGALHPLSFRVTPGLKALLDESASANGRSLTAEIQSRLEQSYVWETARSDVRKWLAERKADIEKMTEESAVAFLRSAGWPVLRETKWGTALLRPGSLALTEDGRTGRVKRASLGEFVVEPDEDLGEPQSAHLSASTNAAPAATPGDDLEETIYRAIRRALRDDREEQPAA